MCLSTTYKTQTRNIVSPSESENIGLGMIISNIRIDGDLDHVDILRDALIKHFSPQSELSRGESSPKLCIEKRNIITLSNKYFSAKICLDSINSFHEVKDEQESKQDIFSKEDGFIIVFSSEHTENAIPSFLTPLHQRALDMNQCGDLLRLCVCVTNTDTSSSNKGTKKELTKKEIEHVYSQRVLWCLDRGYEYVEADLSAHGVSTGFDEREKDGFARIIEAFQGTVWSSALMHKRSTSNENRQQQQQQQQQTRNQENDDNDNTQSQNSLLYKTNEMRMDFSSISSTNQSSNDVSSTVPKVPLNHSDISSTIPLSASAKDNENLRFNLENEEKYDESHFQSSKLDADFNNLESVIKDATRIRQDARDNKLSDEERRKKAAETAMKLLELMDFDDDDDDDSEDGDDGS